MDRFLSWIQTKFEFCHAKEYTFFNAFYNDLIYNESKCDLLHLLFGDTQKTKGGYPFIKDKLSDDKCRK